MKQISQQEQKRILNKWQEEGRENPIRQAMKDATPENMGPWEKAAFRQGWMECCLFLAQNPNFVTTPANKTEGEKNG